MPVSCNHLEYGSIPREMYWDKPLKASPWRLADDISEAMEKMAKINELIDTLPGLDCGMCGSPSCEAFAEDVVLSKAQITDCIFFMKNQKGEKVDLPAPFRKKEDNK